MPDGLEKHAAGVEEALHVHERLHHQQQRLLRLAVAPRLPAAPSQHLAGASLCLLFQRDWAEGAEIRNERRPAKGAAALRQQTHPAEEQNQTQRDWAAGAVLLARDRSLDEAAPLDQQHR